MALPPYPKTESRRRDSAGPHVESLGELLAARARRATDARLALDVALGLLVVSAVVAWRPPAWPLAAAAATGLAAFGAWGIADRELADGTASRAAARALRLLRAGAVAAGAAAVVTFAFALLFGVLGNWIS